MVITRKQRVFVIFAAFLIFLNFALATLGTDIYSRFTGNVIEPEVISSTTNTPFVFYSVASFLGIALFVLIVSFLVYKKLNPQ